MDSKFIKESDDNKLINLVLEYEPISVDSSLASFKLLKSTIVVKYYHNNGNLIYYVIERDGEENVYENLYESTKEIFKKWYSKYIKGNFTLSFLNNLSEFRDFDVEID